MTIPDPYKVLQVDPQADDDVIEAAYRRLAKRYHPDVAGPGGQDRMVQLNLARDILRDPMRRSALDRARLRAEATSAQVAAAEGRVWAAANARATAQRTSQHRGDSGWPFPGMPDPSADAFAGGGASTASSWTSGRSTHGSQYDPSTMGTSQGDGAAGPPPGNPSGSLLSFGRYAGWTLGEIARVDLEYLEWLHRTPIGRQFQGEIDGLLRGHGRAAGNTAAVNTHGLYRRR